jgi:aminoglycoside phosphotransferase family enzyme/predicted kinase
MTAQTKRVLDFLSDPASYPHAPRTVTMVQTHASWVFIAPPLVYKIKQPVNLGFLDFSTLDLRHADCEREVVLNRRLAEDVYLGVVGICEHDGRLRFGGDGTVVEWCVKMRELDQRFLLSHLLKNGTVGTTEMDRIIETLRRFYTSHPPPPPEEVATTVERLRRATDDNLRIAREWSGRSIQPAQLDAIEEFTSTFYAKRGALLESRIRGGWIRDCHGDLHTEHIHLTPERVRIYDCIEFNTRFRYIDVANDIAFLAMDLDFNGRHDLSEHLVRRFSEAMHDAALVPLMDFYKCYRACVRGKVESLHSAVETTGEAERAESLSRAQKYFQLALRYAVAGSAPCAFVFMGRIASGKSSLAEAAGASLGWEVFSSDRIRKTIAGVPATLRPQEAERAELYAAQMTARTYDTLAERAFAAVQRGGGAVVDATFSKRRQRDALRQRAAEHGIALIWIEAIVSDDVARGRLRARESRTDVISDARLEDFASLNARYEAPGDEEGVIRTANEKPVAEVARGMLVHLAQHRATCS